MTSKIWTDCYDLLEQGETVDEKTEGMVLKMLRWEPHQEHCTPMIAIACHIAARRALRQFARPVPT